jgi:glycosyltransferase involved in cell wall biosynthesis
MALTPDDLGGDSTLRPPSQRFEHGRSYVGAGPSAWPEGGLLLSCVVPCFNEEAGLHALYDRLSSSANEAAGDQHEIVLVDDGSTDLTWKTIVALHERDPRVVGVRLSRNHGHQLALTAGLDICRGKRILIIDADLQDPPELLTQMMTLMDNGADVVYGQRVTRAGETWYKRLSASLFYRILSRLTDLPIPLDTGDFRLISRRALNVLRSMPEQHRFVRGMISWIGFEQIPIRYDRSERFAGVTKYPLHKMLRFALDAITGFSIQPLRLSLYVGVLFGFFSLVLLIYTFISWLYFNAVQGWTSLMAVVLMLGCVQMLFLGILGEYLGRLFMQSKQRPLFVISDIVAEETTDALAALPPVLGQQLEVNRTQRPRTTSPGTNSHG